MTTKVARRRSYHHGDLRRALLEAAVDRIARRGAEPVTLRALARAVGVSPAAPYRHFTDKEALLAAVAEEGFRDLAAAMRRAAAGAADETARLGALGMAYVGYARAHPAQFKVMFGPAIARPRRHPALAAAGAEAYQLLLDAVGAVERAGELRAGTSTDTAALAAWSTVHGLATLAVDGQIGAGASDRELDSRVRGVLDGLLHGLGRLGSRHLHCCDNFDDRV